MSTFSHGPNGCLSFEEWGGHTEGKRELSGWPGSAPKTRAPFPVWCHGYCRPSLSNVGRETPFLTCTHAHMRPERALNGRIHLAVHARVHKCLRGNHWAIHASSFPQSSSETHTRFFGDSYIFFPLYLFISSLNLGSVSEFLDLLYLLTSFMFIFFFTFSPPFLLGLFFFELHSAYSRAYNLTPPSSLTLSLHPLAKLPFRSRGNPLISQTQLPRLHWRGGGVMRSGGEEPHGTQSFSNDCGLCFHKLSMFSQHSPYGVWVNVEVDSGWFSFWGSVVTTWWCLYICEVSGGEADGRLLK